MFYLLSFLIISGRPLKIHRVKEQKRPFQLQRQLKHAIVHLKKIHKNIYIYIYHDIEDDPLIKFLCNKIGLKSLLVPEVFLNSNFGSCVINLAFSVLMFSILVTDSKFRKQLVRLE